MSCDEARDPGRHRVTAGHAEVRMRTVRLLVVEGRMWRSATDFFQGVRK